MTFLNDWALIPVPVLAVAIVITATYLAIKISDKLPDGEELEL
jgi:hypothetical protein